MAVESTRVPLGTALPDLTLPDLDGIPRSLPGIRDDGPLLIVFACNHCPYVRHVERMLGELVREFEPGLAVAAICANDVTQYAEDDVPGLRDQVRRAGWAFPYLVDADQVAAREFGAACTPDFFLYDRAGLLAYHGALDASSPRNGIPLTGDLLRSALADVTAGRPVTGAQRPALGCGIKWKPGNDPVT